VILHASPAVEAPYELPTEILENVDVVIGSADELLALLPAQASSSPVTGVAVEVARDLVEQCGVWAVVTDLRSELRRVAAVGPLTDDVVRVESPRVRQVGVPDAVGSAAAFCAAWALAALRPVQSATIATDVKWRETSSPLSDKSLLIDTLMTAAGAEAWVARSAGGYLTSLFR
jgi:sugar/nucleoside kinase (ribokinase family)